MQLFGKFNKILYCVVRATLRFRKYKVALNRICRMFSNFAESSILSILLKYCNKKKFTVPRLKYEVRKLKLRVFLVGHSVAMANHCVQKIILTWLPMIGQFFRYHDCSINLSRVVLMTHQNLSLLMC